MRNSKEVETLKSKLQQVRRASLAAINKGDYRAVARLTLEAANLNKALLTMAGPIWEQ
jgi:hypothetical protein